MIHEFSNISIFQVLIISCGFSLVQLYVIISQIRFALILSGFTLNQLQYSSICVLTHIQIGLCSGSHHVHHVKIHLYTVIGADSDPLNVMSHQIVIPVKLNVVIQISFHVYFTVNDTHVLYSKIHEFVEYTADIMLIMSFSDVVSWFKKLQLSLISHVSHIINIAGFGSHRVQFRIFESITVM